MFHLAVLSFLMWTGPGPGAATVFEINIRLLPQQTATLPCRAAKDKSVVALDWSRPDMSPEVVFLFRDNHVYQEFQHPSFRNRVDLLDRDMKDGDVSLVLRNVTTADSGSYECRVLQKKPLPFFWKTRRSKRSVMISDPIIIIKLQIVHSGPIDTNKEDKVIHNMKNWNRAFEEMDVREYLTLVSVLAVVVILLMAMTRCVTRYWSKHPSR
uniref:Ig-like domain-containing protein n=1 Tax=Nothobranchius kadleci TaxID=1051664 RepID=A0A1A8BUB3_NOTKA